MTNSTDVIFTGAWCNGMVVCYSIILAHTDTQPVGLVFLYKIYVYFTAYY